MDGKTAEIFQNYFITKINKRTTRNTGLLIEMPIIKLEFFRKSFAYSGAKIFNSLPLDIRDEDEFNSFSKKVKKCFGSIL